ncbi:MAG: DUF983 domain-containing protein [Chitinophagaceae bacterium]|nr:DUF983 domain-containing protein [Chitinophagaceae bacterium]MCW5913915.1 DUF983 domain-containing protein [Chitinophagaceae bacterium]MCZ2397974.1 DUF983 domain-containing protein [Chitinophagales bacterium]
MSENDKPTPNYLWSVLHVKCPRCRRGDMFKQPNPYKPLRPKAILDMYHDCPVCSQTFDLEPGFWYGTGYMSYAITVLFSAVTFFLWWLIIGFSLDDNRLIYWIVVNAILNLALQPYFMRVSRLLYLNLFVHYNPNFDTEETVKFT